MVELAIWLIAATVVVYFALAGLGLLVAVLGDGRWKIAVAGFIILAACVVVYSYNHTHPIILTVLGAAGLYLYVTHERAKEERSIMQAAGGNHSVVIPSSPDLVYKGEDDMYKDVVEFAAKSGKIRVSMVQREFHIGYARAARLVEEMEEHGLLGEADGAKPRDVLISVEQARHLGQNQAA